MSSFSANCIACIANGCFCILNPMLSMYVKIKIKIRKLYRKCQGYNLLNLVPQIFVDDEKENSKEDKDNECKSDEGIERNDEDNQNKDEYNDDDYNEYEHDDFEEDVISNQDEVANKIQCDEVVSDFVDGSVGDNRVLINLADNKVVGTEINDDNKDIDSLNSIINRHNNYISNDV